MPSLHCSICGIDWPVRDEFATCPSCDDLGGTWRHPTAKPDRRWRELAREVGLVYMYGGLSAQDEALALRFRAWLDTVGPEDFRRTLAQ